MALNADQVRDLRALGINATTAWSPRMVVRALENSGDTSRAVTDRIYDWSKRIKNPYGSTTTDDTQMGIPTPVDEGAAEGPSAADQSARAVLESTLAQWGLEGLADQMWGRILSGIPIEQILLDIRQSDQYKARFPAMETLRGKGRAISEAEYIAYERSATQMFRQFGLPTGFYDEPSDFANFLGREVSLRELGDRIGMAARATFEVPDDVRAQFRDLYGIAEGDLTAFFLDPDRAQPMLEQRFVSAQIGGAATRTGFGQLTRDEAERLASLEVDPRQAEAGFGALTQSRELFGTLTGQERTEGADIGRAEQLGAAFEGEAGAQQRIEARRRRRQSTFEEGGGFAGGREGFALGEAL